MICLYLCSTVKLVRVSIKNIVAYFRRVCVSVLLAPGQCSTEPCQRAINFVPCVLIGWFIAVVLWDDLWRCGGAGGSDKTTESTTLLFWAPQRVASHFDRDMDCCVTTVTHALLLLLWWGCLIMFELDFPFATVWFYFFADLNDCVVKVKLWLLFSFDLQPKYAALITCMLVKCLHPGISKSSNKAVKVAD